MKKIRITKLPQFKGGGAYRTFGTHTPPQDNTVTPGKGFNDNRSTPEIKVNKTLKPIPREEATLEAEKGETVVTSLNKDGLPEFYHIAGKPHSRGGTPLNLPEHSFIFSRDRSLAIKNKDILKFFNATKKGSAGLTPAEVSKNFNVNKYREILANPSSDKLQVKTAELMIKNFVKKLGALSLVQEASKGFEGGLPSIDQPFLEGLGIDPMSIVGPESSPEQQEAPMFKLGGELPKYQKAGQVVGKDDIKLKKGEKVIFIPGQGYLILDRRGNVVGRLNQPENPSSGNPNDFNTQSKALVSSKTTAVQNIPADAVKWDPTKEGYDESQVEPDDYILKNGRYYRVKGKKVTPYNGRPLDQLNPKLGKYAESYGRLEDKIMSSPEIQKKLVEKYRENVNKAKPKGILTQSDIDAAKTMTPEEIVNNYLVAQEQIMIIQAQMPNVGSKDTKDTWDKGIDSATGLPREYVKAANQIGIDPLSIAQTFAFQAAYIGMQDLADENPKEWQNFRLPQLGYADEGAGKKNRMTISEADGWWGNTTTGQAQLFADTVGELDLDEVDDMDVQNMPPIIPDYQPPLGPFPEDVNNLNLANALLYSTRKGRPALMMPEPTLINPQFTDFYAPTSRAQASAVDMATNNPFMSGPRYGATASKIAADIAPTIMATQEQSDKFNIASRMDADKFNATVLNQFDPMRKAAMNSYLDKVEAGNQQFNTEIQAKLANKTAMKNAMITNMRDIALANEQSEDFAINPSWRPGDPIPPVYKKYNPYPITPNNQYSELDAVSQGAERLMAMDPRLSPEDALTQARLIMKGDSSQDILQQQLQMAGYINPMAYGMPT
jgi:hypothetical protein